ncbi:hypothetical protein GW17_00008704 [Ensete ventricosum]|nr:hypothetical protein GW17_00008704 [Ensete ventricosum]
MNLFPWVLPRLVGCWHSCDIGLPSAKNVYVLYVETKVASQLGPIRVHKGAYAAQTCWREGGFYTSSPGVVVGRYLMTIDTIPTASISPRPGSRGWIRISVYAEIFVGSVVAGGMPWLSVGER